MSSFFIPPDLMALARFSSMASGELGAQPPTISFRDLTSPQPGSFSLSRAWCILTGTMTSFFVILGLSQAFIIASLTAALVSSFSAPRFFIDCATWKGFAPFLAKVLRIINNFALFSGDTPHAAIALCARTIAVKSFGGISAFTRALFFCFDKSLYSAVLAVSSLPKAFINNCAFARISSSLSPLAANSIFIIFITSSVPAPALMREHADMRAAIMAGSIFSSMLGTAALPACCQCQGYHHYMLQLIELLLLKSLSVYPLDQK